MTPAMKARDEDGSVAILTVGAMVLLLAMVVVTLDVGMLYFSRRNLQNAADEAAMAAALDLTRSRAAVDASVTANGFPPEVVTAVQVGRWSGIPGMPAASRFQVGAASPNGVRVSLSAKSPLFFMPYFNGRKEVVVTAAATAAHIPEASFSAGTGLASIDEGLLNAVLGGLLNSTINLRVMDYEGLIQADVNLLAMLDALATRIGAHVGRYEELLTSTVTVGDLLAATAAALQNPPGRTVTAIEAQALNALQLLQLQVNGTTSLKLGQLLNLGIWEPLPVGSSGTPTALHANLALFDLVSLSAQVANGKNMVAVDLPATIPGVAGVNLKLTVGEGEQRIGLGPVGTTLHTAQTRLLLEVELLPILGRLVYLPLYVEIASGNARLDEVTCGADPLHDSTVVLGAQTGPAALHVGTVSDGAMTNFSTPPVPNPAKVVNVLGLIGLTASASATAGTSAYTPVTFTRPEIDAGTRKQVSSSGTLSGLTGSLVQSLVLKPDGLVGILLAPLVSQILGAVKPVLVAVINALGLVDGVLDQLLKVLGVRTGVIDVAVSGVRCGVPTLVH